MDNWMIARRVVLCSLKRNSEANLGSLQSRADVPCFRGSGTHGAIQDKEGGVGLSHYFYRNPFFLDKGILSLGFFR